jgi:hypothetical protein
MIEKIYSEFDEIMNLQKQVMNSAGEKYKELLENVKRNTSATKYGTQNMYLGYFCPSLVMDKIVGGFKKGKLQTNIPKNKSGSYVVYDIDSEGKLLRMQDINSYGTIVETYIVKENDAEFSIKFSDKKLTIHDGPSTRTMYENGKLKRFDIIDNSYMWSEIYLYNADNSQKVECRKYYYVPNLKGSDKSIPLGIKGSPAKLFIMDIELDNQERVIKIEHNELIDGQKILTYTYKKISEGSKKLRS